MRDLADIVTSTANPPVPQAITASAYSASSKDKGVAALDYASGEIIYGVCAVTTLFAGASNAGVNVYWTDDTPSAGAFGSNTPVDLQLLGLLPAAAAPGAATSFIQTPLAPNLTTQQLMGFHFVPVTANLSAGAVVAGFTTDPDTWKAYAASYTVNG